MTEGVECLCPRCGYEHTAFEVSERIAAAKIEEAKKAAPKRVPPKSASWPTSPPLMRTRGVAFSSPSPSARRPASPYVDPFPAASGRVEKGSSAKAVVLYGAAIVLGMAIVALLATRIFQFASSPRAPSVPTGPRPGLGTTRDPPRGSPPATKPALPEQTESTIQENPVDRWVRPKNWYERECANAEKLVERFQSGGYRMTGRSVSAMSVRRRIAELRKCVARNNSRDAEAAHAALVNDVREYSAHCVWTKGLRHPKYAHILSGQNVGEWMVEEGYMLVNPGTTDWSVKKVPVAVICRKCKCSRYQMISVTCPACQGRKVLPSGGGYSRPPSPRWGRGAPPMPPPPVMKVQCYQCRGAGSVPQQRQCPQCQGTGTEIR